MSALESLCESKGLRAIVRHGATANPTFPNSNPWTVTLVYKRRRVTTPFYTGSANHGDPTAADVLSCLISDATMGLMCFEDFCSELGYDQDSREAERIWKSCQRMTPKISRLLGADFNLFAGAEH